MSPRSISLALSLAVILSASAVHAVPPPTVAAAAPPAASPADPHAGHTISMQARELPLRVVVEQIATEAGLRIEGVERLDAAPAVTLSLQDVPVDTVLELVGAEGDVSLVRDGDMVRVGSARQASGSP